MMAKRYIAWNENKTEGVIFDRKIDADCALDGKHRADPDVGGLVCISSLAEAFFEIYGADNCTLEEIESPDHA
jgi:hypothetical protein